MAALVLSVAGAAVGSVFGPVGAIAGRMVGALVGNMLDRSLTATPGKDVEGPRLADLDVMASSEGAPIPRVYGRARLAGQVIWATPLEEVVTVSDNDSGGGGGKGMLFAGGGSGSGGNGTTTTYSYFANFAVGLCEGPIGRIARVWADGKPLDLSGIAMRLHRGDEAQAPDGLIVAREGASHAPAYRGLAYVVFERLPLADFGNRIPQLSFEIVRPVGALERMVRAVTLIPGSTEFGYEPAEVARIMGPGTYAPENRHVAAARSDVVASLDDLQAVCPLIERVAVVVAWFGDDLRADQCTVAPRIDNAVKQTQGATWNVAGVTRATARLVSLVDGNPAFGGTPSDDSVRHLIAELKARGLKVTFYPFVMMDIPAGNGRPDPWSGAGSQPAYPWRGRITCDPAPGRPGSVQGTATAATQVAQFFSGGEWNYRRMVLHYANLVQAAGGVEAFLIGSEFKALTRVRSGSGVYPAVDALVSLAAEVKAIVGAPTLVTYAADWTEYGADVVDTAAREVRFPLDKLWGSPHVGAVGIDYYAPLADWRDEAGHLDRANAASTYDVAYLRGNLAGGEGFDWYYADAGARAAQVRTPITDGLNKPWTFRVKDVWAWWANAHRERVGGVELGSPTAWAPRSKPIWLTEIGCPAVDKGANQPNVFPDPKSSESFVPHFSNGARDDLIQRRYLEAVLTAFDPAFGASDTFNPVSPVYGGRMVEPSAIHLWTWDARPYPVFPVASEVWSDAPNWQTGHWLTGRLGGAPLDALVAALAADSGVTGIDTRDLREVCDGYVVDRPMSPRAMIEPLAQVYAFDATAADGTLRFVQRGGAPVAEFTEDDLVDDGKGALSRLTRAQETELPREAAIGFIDALMDYRHAAATSRRLVGGAARVLATDLAVITNDAAAARRAEIFLQDFWAGRERAEFSLGQRALRLSPGDVVALTQGGRRRLFEVSDIVDTEARRIAARSIDPEVFSLPLAPPRQAAVALPTASGPPQVWLMDLPAIDGSGPPVVAWLAASCDPWPGALTVWRSVDGASYQPALALPAPATVGVTLDDLARGPASRWDHGGTVRVRLAGGVLASRSDAQVFEGANAAALRTPDGAWEVMQFARAELVAERTYRLSRLLRGQGGSDHAIADVLPAGAPFVLLDAQVMPLLRGYEALERPVRLRVAASHRSHDDAAATALTHEPRPTALKPLAPVHLRARRRGDGVHLTWIRRTRIGGDSWVGEVPLGEDAEAYALDILSDGAVVRSLAVETPHALYAGADEIADFGAPQTTLEVRVAQLSRTIGAGFPTHLTLTV